MGLGLGLGLVAPPSVLGAAATVEGNDASNPGPAISKDANE